MKLGKLIVGMGLGAVIGTLLAPKKGSETYEELKEFATKTYDDLKNLTKEDVEAKIGESIDALKKSVDEFDAKEFQEASKEKLDELVALMNEYANKVQESSQYAAVKDGAYKAYEVLKVKVNALLVYLKNKGVDVEEVEKTIEQVEEKIEEAINNDK